MASRKRRFVSLLIPLAGLLVVTGVIAPFASAQEFTATFTVNPTDAVKAHVITGTPLDANGPNVEVHVTAPEGFEGSLDELIVTLNLVSGAGFATGGLSGNTANPNTDGNATFPNLKIADPNEAMFTSYGFEAVVSGGPTTTSAPIGAAFASDGAFSDTFDIWDAGCSSPCTAAVKNNSQSYHATDGLLTLSDLPSSDLPDFECLGQTLVLGEHIFTHETTATTAVFVTSKISKLEMKKASNNGQVFVKWCIGLEDEQPWIDNGAAHTLQDVNGGAPGGNLWVGFAPKCPKTNQSEFAPCIVKQKADPAGGNVTTGWLPGGDPPRRT